MLHWPSGKREKQKERKHSTDQAIRRSTEKRLPSHCEQYFLVYKCTAIAYIHVNKKPTINTTCWLFL